MSILQDKSFQGLGIMASPSSSPMTQMTEDLFPGRRREIVVSRPTSLLTSKEMFSTSWWPGEWTCAGGDMILLPTCLTDQTTRE
jgi:hypothetical protein